VLKYPLGGQLRIGSRMTYHRLRTQVDCFAAALDELGVRKGDRVALMLPNSPQFVIAFFAALRLGAIVVNTNPTYTAPELQHQLADSGAETIVLLNLFLPRLRKVQADEQAAPGFCHRLEVGRAITPLSYHSFSLKLLRPLYTRVNTLSDFGSLSRCVFERY
jgi:acyl-CoA synthetase (AMP-forming)/AMP-acid ligase II